MKIQKKITNAKKKFTRTAMNSPGAKNGAGGARILSVLFLAGMLMQFLPVSVVHGETENIIGNSDLNTETLAPAGWNHGQYGDNVPRFSYPLTGVGSSRAVRVDMAEYATGDAKWYFDDVPVKPSTQYVFSDTSFSDVPTSVDIRYRVKRTVWNALGQMERHRYRYVKLGDVPAESSPTMREFTFTTPSNVTSLTIFHLIDRNGYLVTDNYSLRELGTGTTTADTVDPTVSVTSPISGATISGTTTVSVNANDNIGVAGVRLFHSGTNHSDIPIGTEDTVAPYSFEWNTFGAANGVHMLQAKARDAAGNIATSTTISVTINNATTTDITAPTVSITSPIDGATVSGTTTVLATMTDNVAIASSTLYINGVATASLGTSSPATYNWDTTSFANGTSTLYVLARDLAGNTATSSTVSIRVQNASSSDTLAPTVSVTSPSSGATIYGTTTISVNATDNVGVTGVSILLDGVLTGTEDTTAPYDFSWNTTGVANGSHTIAARARDAAGNVATSTAISINVSN